MKFILEYFDINNTDPKFNAKLKYFAIAYEVDDTGKKVKNKQPIFLRKARNDEDGCEHIQLVPNMRFSPIPSTGERDITQANAQSGAGKSYLMDEYCQYFKILHPNKKIHIFTTNDFKGDVSLTHQLYNPIPLKEFIENLYETDDWTKGDMFKDSLLVFDDFQGGNDDKDFEKKVYHFITMIVENMRKKNVFLYLITHRATNYRLTSSIIPELQRYIVYPQSQQVCSDRILNHYLGLKKIDVRRIVNEEDSRWVMVDCRRKCILTEHSVEVLNSM